MNKIRMELSLQKALKVYFPSPSLSRDINFTFQTLLVIINHHHHHHHLENVSLSFPLTRDLSFLLAKVSEQRSLCVEPTGGLSSPPAAQGSAPKFPITSRSYSPSAAVNPLTFLTAASLI